MIQDDRKQKRKATTQGNTQETTETGTWHDFFNQDESTDPTVERREKDTDIPWDLFGKVTCENPF